jgi:hypothetical protein
VIVNCYPFYLEIRGAKVLFIYKTACSFPDKNPFWANLMMQIIFTGFSVVIVCGYLVKFDGCNKKKRQIICLLDIFVYICIRIELLTLLR